MRNHAATAFFIVLAAAALFSNVVSAAASFPVCDKGAVCIFFGFNPEKVAQGPSGANFQTSGFTCPVNAPITGAFGVAYTNVNKESRVRQGVEMRVPDGSDVKAPADGYVVDAGYDALQLGDFVIIQHASNPDVSTKIGYLQGTSVRPDDKDKNGQKIRITKGQVIGKSGNTGAATGPSVYFELDRGGIPQRDVESICKTAAASTSGPVATVGAVDCSIFSGQPMPSWNVIPGGRFGAPGRSYPGGHDGFDYGNNACGTPIAALWPGQVQYYKDIGAGYGNEVSIKTTCTDGTTRMVAYDHVQRFNEAVLSKGQVQAGEIIAYVGDYNGRYPCHLHVNVFGPPYRIINGANQGNVLNPEPLIPGGLQGRLA